jgi:CheY-like chemotaxis protein
MIDLAKAKPIDILLVEDNDGDARLTEEALKESKLLNSLYRVKDGVEAIDFVYRQNGFATAPRPDLILLDLNLPKKDGREVLAELKANDDLKTIPIVVLTTSGMEEDVLRSYQLHANCYITKPVDLDKFLIIVRRLENFWLSIVKLPSKAAV